ncbi:MAG: metabolite traffic protein EboE [Burkholderiales bacterium]|nr:metabolite traffic protein EboE [Burkholderiales bacterium]
MRLPDGTHLTYCSNIHPGETWAEVRANLERYVPQVRDAVAPQDEFGVGLRLSARAAAELSDAECFDEFVDFLSRERLYVFTLNGFPYGTFHGTRVKEDAYLPDWRDAERLRYTNLLADLFQRLLPEGIEGSISTVPCAYKSALGDPADVERMTDNLLCHVAHLVEMERRSGKHIALALEPEPCCYLETVDETIAFFEHHLFSAAAVRRLGKLTGLSGGPAADALHRHIGACLDLCHAAVEFEDPALCAQRLLDSGIRIPKAQISAGLRIARLTPEALEALHPYEDAVYLHQVVESGADGLRRFNDLPEALHSAQEQWRDAEWRVHFHVPVFVENLGPFSSTQFFIREALTTHRRTPISSQLEVETYTWDVLPPALRSIGVEQAVARELQWVLAQLRESDTPSSIGKTGTSG